MNMPAKPHGNIHRTVRLLLVTVLLVGFGSSVTPLTPPASACSVLAPETTIEFVGVATKRVSVSSSSTNPEWVTYRWTFTVKKWIKGTGGAKRLKVGTRITINVLERTENTDGPQTSCSDMGVVTRYQKGRNYSVGASRSFDNQSWFVDNYTGKLQLK